MKKIIVPTDFSRYSENALKTASLYAKTMNLEIIVVHMLEISNAFISVSNSNIQEQTAYRYNMAKQRLEEF